MTERTRKILVFMTLPVALIWAVSNMSGSKKTVVLENEEAPETVEIQPVTASLNQPDPRLIDISAKSSEKWGSDPFRVDPKAPVTKILARDDVGWSLSGIIFSAKDPIAFINGKTVRPGDTIDKAVVARIDKRSVTLTYNGRTLTLLVNKG